MIMLTWIQLKILGLEESSLTIGFTEEQLMIRQMSRDLATKKIAKTAEEIDREGYFSRENVKLMAEVGLFGIHIPEEYGGSGGDAVSHALAIEEIARVCASTSVLLTTQALATAPFLIAGTEEQKARYLVPMALGKSIGAFGITEPGAGSDVSAITTTAVLDGDQWVLNGNKCFITNAGEADTYTIVAYTDKSKKTKGISLIIVEKDTPGLSFGKREDKLGIRGSTTREVIMENCRVPKENLLGPEGQGFNILMKCFDNTRVGVGAQALGIAQGAFDVSLEYAKDRIQFGKPIAAFQGIQFMLADMATQIEAARLLVHLAASKIDEGGERISKYASMAKMFASDTAMKVTTDAVQILGGYGYMREYPVERMMRDAKITQIYEGTNQVQRIIIAKQLLD